MGRNGRPPDFELVTGLCTVVKTSVDAMPDTYWSINTRHRHTHMSNSFNHLKYSGNTTAICAVR